MRIMFHRAPYFMAAGLTVLAVAVIGTWMGVW